MIANPFLGVVFHWLGGLASGSFYVPFRGVRKWAWEVYWLVGGIFQLDHRPVPSGLDSNKGPLGGPQPRRPRSAR